MHTLLQIFSYSGSAKYANLHESGQIKFLQRKTNLEIGDNKILLVYESSTFKVWSELGSTFKHKKLLTIFYSRGVYNIKG